jgi:hypothetical protein
MQIVAIGAALRHKDVPPNVRLVPWDEDRSPASLIDGADAVVLDLAGASEGAIQDIAASAAERPVLVRTSLSPPHLASLVRLAESISEIRVSSAEFAYESLRELQATAALRWRTGDVVRAINPVLPIRARRVGLIALLLAVRARQVGEIAAASAMSARTMRERFAELGMPAHQMLGYAVACHGLALRESGKLSVKQVAALLGTDARTYSARVRRVTGDWPTALESRGFAAVLQDFRQHVCGAEPPPAMLPAPPRGSYVSPAYSTIRETSPL